MRMLKYRANDERRKRRRMSKLSHTPGTVRLDWRDLFIYVIFIILIWLIYLFYYTDLTYLISYFFTDMTYLFM